MRKLAFLLGIAGLAVLAVGLTSSLQVSATNVSIESNLTVSPGVVSFQTTFPGEVLFHPLTVQLSDGFLRTAILDDVEYEVHQRPKPRVDSPAERAYCEEHPADFSRCYPSLCPYLSKEPDGQPPNDTGVPAFHDPNAPTSVAQGRLAKSDNDLVDRWVIDLHVPCFRGQCDQESNVPVQYQLDPTLEHEVFGCDLVVKVLRVSYNGTPTRTQGFWKTHTQFTSNVLQNQLGGAMTVGSGGHTRIVTNSPGNGQSRLFGAYYASIPKQTNNQNRNALDQARIRLLQQLVTAKLNCAAFGCAAATQTLIASADAAYATGPAAAITPFVGQLDAYNNSGDSLPIPPALGPAGAATTAQSSQRANRVFWDSP